MNHQYILYSSEGCHLCEQALALCLPLMSTEQKKSLKIVDIVDDEALVELYGVHIPVLKRMNDNQQLFWPFTTKQIVAFI